MNPNPGSRSNAVHVVSAIIVDAEGRFLCTLRTPDRAFPLHWETPGGKVEPGEAPTRALSRELWEELGLVVLPRGYVGTVSFDLDGAEVTVDFLEVSLGVGLDTGRVDVPIPNPDNGVAGFAWLHPDDLRNLPLTPGTRFFMAAHVWKLLHEGAIPAETNWSAYRRTGIPLSPTRMGAATVCMVHGRVATQPHLPASFDPDAAVQATLPFDVQS